MLKKAGFNEFEVFAAGPYVRKIDVKTQCFVAIKKRMVGLGRKVKPFGFFLDYIINKRVKERDFSSRNPLGVYLRAVIRG